MKPRKLHRPSTVAIAIAAAFVAPGALAQQSESCGQLMVLVDEVGDGENLREEFRDARLVAEADDPEQCALYVARVESAGGLLADPAAADAASGETVESATETVQVEQQATIEGEVEVVMPDPEVDVEQDPAEIAVRTPPPEVRVSQGQPRIEVRQAKPIIRVQMPQPTITIEQPAPEIVVTMPEPGIDVATAQPTVEVNIPEPRVTVRQPDPRLNVDLTADAGGDAAQGSSTTIERSDEAGVMTVRASGLSAGATEPRIEFVENEEPPTISYEGVEPVVDYVAAEPEVRFESAGEPSIELVESGEPKIMIRSADEQSADAEEAPAAQSLAAAGDAERRDPREAFGLDEAAAAAYADASPGVYTVDELDGMDVVNARGEELGEVERVVRNAEETYVIVEHGGWFFGLNDKEIALPIEDLTISSEGVVLRGLTEEQIESMPDYDYANEQVLEGAEEIEIGTRG